MVPRFQFTIWRVLVATFWMGLCFGAWAYEPPKSSDLVYLSVLSFRFTPIPAAIGALFGRALWGAAIGIGLYVLYVAWIVLALSIWGGT